MKILDIRPHPGGGNVVARFDVETPFGMRFFNLMLKDSAAGWRVFSPSYGRTPVATFTPELNERITRAAVLAFEGVARFEIADD